MGNALAGTTKPRHHYEVGYYASVSRALLGVAEFLSETGVDLSADPVALMRIRDACETTKVALSSVDADTVTVPFIHGDAGGAYNLAVPITRRKFEDLTFHLTDATIDACRAALMDWKAGLYHGDSIDELLLIGLATRTPMVRESAERYFDKRARRDLAPDAVVALGAAVQAGVLTGSSTDALLLDIQRYDVAVETLLRSDRCGRSGWDNDPD